MTNQTQDALKKKKMMTTNDYKEKGDQYDESCKREAKRMKKWKNERWALMLQRGFW